MRGFTSEDCDYLISSYSNYEEEIGNKEHDFEVVKIRFRKENSAKFITTYDKSLCDFVYKRLDGLNITQVRVLKIMKYEVGDSLAKHQDFNRYGVNKLFRTILVQLSNPTDYEGGDLIVENKIQSRERGSVSIIDPNDEHEVTKITSGTRYSLVVFLKDSDFFIPKSII